VISFSQVPPPLQSPIRATCPTNLILLDLITRIIFVEQYRSFSSSLCSFLHSPVTWSLLDPNICLCTLFSVILRLCSSLVVRDQVPHPYKTTGKVIVLYILVYILLDTTSIQLLIQQGRWSRPTKIRGLQIVNQKFISAIFKQPSSDTTDVTGEDPKKCSCSWHNWKSKNDFSVKQQECVSWHSSDTLQRRSLFSKYHKATLCARTGKCNSVYYHKEIRASLRWFQETHKSWTALCADFLYQMLLVSDSKYGNYE
jgi:hypothetical protein